MNKKSLIKAINECIDHWNRMIKWFKSRSKDEEFDFWNHYAEIFNDLNEDFSSDYCSLCKEFFENDCELCPLYLTANDCNRPGSPWKTVMESPTCGKWVENAKKFVIVLKGLKKWSRNQ